MHHHPQQRPITRSSSLPHLLPIYLLLFGGIFLWLQTYKKVSTSLTTTTTHHQVALSSAPNIKMIPTVSYSLSAIVRKRKSNDTKQQSQEYALVHERPPRGWWLPGGGIEHKDITPLDGAIREAVEEAGSPTLLPLLSAASSTSSSEQLPTMTHLLSLQQSPGRIRFIFRGEWIDDNADNTKQDTCILKCPPGDDESIEAKWVTLDMVASLSERKRGDATYFNLLQPIKDPWLRGNEPKEFFGLLEHARQEDELIPGLPVHKMNLSEEYTQQKQQRQDEEVLGAFFGRYQSEESLDLVHSGSRAALWITLQCRLIVYCPIQQTFAVVEDTKTFPSSVVSDQSVMTFKQLVHNMIAEWRIPSDEDEEENVGLLRVEHIIRANGRDATLTAYPFVLTNSEINTGDGSIRWVSVNELSDPLERRLSETMIADKRKDQYLSLDILKDKEH